MSRQIRTLIAVICAVLVVGGALTALLLLPDPSTSNPSSAPTSSDTSIVLIDKTLDGNGKEVKEPVKSVQVFMKNAQYTVSKNADGVLRVEAYDSLPVNTASIDTLVEYVTSFAADRLVIANPTDPSVYGFVSADDATVDAQNGDASSDEEEKPVMQWVEVTYHDDTVFRLEIGNTAPDNASYYVRKASDSAVYLMEQFTVDTVLRNPVEYIGKALISPPEVDDTELSVNITAEAVLRNMDLSGTVRPKPISFRLATDTDDGTLTLAGYVITKPYLRGCTLDDKFQEYIAITSLTAYDVVAAYPTDEQLAEYGLKDPHSVAEFDLVVRLEKTNEDKSSTVSYKNIQHHTVKLGKKDGEGHYYGMVDGIDVVYLLSEGTVPWAEVQYDDLADTLLFMENITDIAEVAVTIDGVKSVMEFAHYPDQSEADKKLICTINGKTYDTTSTRRAYQALMNILRTSHKGEFDPNGKTPAIEIQLTPNNPSRKEKLIRLYKVDANVYYCVNQSGEEYFVTGKSCETMLEKFALYLAGEKLES